MAGDGSAQTVATGKTAGQHDIGAGRLVEGLLGVVVAENGMPGDGGGVDLGLLRLGQLGDNFFGQMGVTQNRFVGGEGCHHILLPKNFVRGAV